MLYSIEKKFSMLVLQYIKRLLHAKLHNFIISIMTKFLNNKFYEIEYVHGFSS